MFWLLIALLELLLHAASSVQLYQGSVSFQCPSIEEQTLEIQADVKYGAVEDGVEIGTRNQNGQSQSNILNHPDPRLQRIPQSSQKSKTKSRERHRLES